MQFPDGRLRNFKSRFYARGDRQVEEVDYFEKYRPVVSWNTVILIMRLSINQGWATIHVYFSNIFVRATLVEDFYLALPYYFESYTG